MIAPGQPLGTYTLLDRLGRGGMGEVWVVHHPVLDRYCAAKLIHTGAMTSDPATADMLARRFAREAQATSRLSSPHTVRVFDFGTLDGGVFYYVMELLDGVDLRVLVEGHGPVTPARAVHLLRQACESLAEAHRAGLVHRDVKPANLFASRVGIRADFIKVLDFGLVKSLGAFAEDTQLTTVGAATGSPAFMAPEIVLAEAVDLRADLYALGCVAYWLLTGRLVFEERSAVRMLMAHADRAPEAPSRAAPDGASWPRELDDLVLACLSKAPGDRPASAEALAERLAALPLEPWTDAQATAWWATHAPATAASSASAVSAAHAASAPRNRAPELEDTEPDGAAPAPGPEASETGGGWKPPLQGPAPGPSPAPGPEASETGGGWKPPLQGPAPGPSPAPARAPSPSPDAAAPPLVTPVLEVAPPAGGALIPAPPAPTPRPVPDAPSPPRPDLGVDGDAPPDLAASRVPRPRKAPLESERDGAVARLQDAFGDGDLTLSEYDERLELAARARDARELEAVTRDLPAPPSPAVAAPPATVAQPDLLPALPAKRSRRLLAIFGGANRKGVWEVPAELKVGAVFGGVDLDLREARFTAPVTEIKVLAAFGGVDIRVPPGVHVENTGTGIFGAFDEDSPPTSDGPPTHIVRVTGLAVFGGVDIRHKPLKAAQKKRARLERKD